ncbi:MAG: CoA-binding protein [bacterium]|jgi:predicted CoA-binding protein|nr:CoA-binding protein [Bacillota bacterium]HHW54643.1 CoA-binding protein [Bacillota bacterium]
MERVYSPPTDSQLARILRENTTIAVVGLSDNPARPSYGVARYLQQAGYRIIPVNPRLDTVLGEKAYPTLGAIPGPIEVVNVFRRSEHVPGIMREALAKGAAVLWLQEGVYHQEAAREALAAGMEVVMDRCMASEHWRLLGPGQSRED